MENKDVTPEDSSNLLQEILTHGVDGVGPLSSSEELANEYSFDDNYTNTQARIDSLIRWETSKNFGTGFVTGLGGLITLPVSIPAAIYANFVIQGRLAGAIASLHGHDVKDDRVRTFLMLTLIGGSMEEILKEAGVQLGKKVALAAIKKIPGKVLIEINKKIGFRLVTKAGEKGLVNLAKVVPFLGGAIGGVIDASACYIVGRTADVVFGPETVSEERVETGSD